MLLFKHLKKEVLIYTLVLNGPLFYFSACALLGIKADPEEGFGIVYKIYMVSLLMMGFFLWIKRFFKGGAKIFPLCILFVYAIVGFLQGYKEHILFLQMICFAVPASCIALSMKGRGELAEVMKIMDLLLPIFALSFVFMIKNLYIRRLENLGTYDQTTSYFIAYCFLIDIFLLGNSDKYPKFKFLDKRWYTIFKIVLLPFFIIMAFLGGGRGAFITILMGSLFIFVWNRKQISIKNLIKLCMGYLFLFLFLLLIFGRINEDYMTLLTDNFGRVTSLFANGSVDTSASSGRDVIWKHAWELIKDKPMLGYGLYSYLEVSNWPHNIFLEVLLQGGLLLFFIFVIILALSFSKFHMMLKKDRGQIWLAPLMIFAFTELLFSGSYTFQPYFWFSLSYIYNFSFKRLINVGKSDY